MESDLYVVLNIIARAADEITGLLSLGRRRCVNSHCEGNLICRCEGNLVCQIEGNLICQIGDNLICQIGDNLICRCEGNLTCRCEGKARSNLFEIPPIGQS